MGKRSNFARVERDWYPTPREAVVPLLPHLPDGAAFAEPCAGDGSLVVTLEREGMTCIDALDIEPRNCWVYQQDALDWDCGESADYIITNPPWERSILHPMIQHFARQRPTWLLFDADWMHTKQSAPFMPLLRAVVSVGRVKWIPDSKMTGKDNCAWYHFAPGDSPTVFHGRST
ncbi:MAG: hypothetical protein ACK5PF_09775 [bacterium]